MSISEQTIHNRRSGSTYQVNSLSDVVKFTALASLLAIFVDAAVAHAMFWGNDPYWTYWVTDTLLMATVFGLGTMLFGVGVGRGAVLTAVHVLLLTAYYWSLSPIGLPSYPEWLDLERTWITGLPVHMAVYYTGYLGALWLWGRRQAAHANEANPSRVSLARVGAVALAVSALVVIIAGITQTLLLQEFPGVTWFIMRIAVAVPFTVAWWTLAGTERAAAIAGGIVLAFVLITYGHYLGPVGLPSDPARVFATDSPPAVVHWLPFRVAFMVLLPLTAIVGVVGYSIAVRWLGSQPGPTISRTAMLTSGAAAAGLIVLGAVTAPDLGAEGNQLQLASTGDATIARGRDAKPFTSGAANMWMKVTNRNTHRTPLPPHDQMELEAMLTSEDGRAFQLHANQLMISDPKGRFTTWYGVGFEKWHNGRSGIGLPQLLPRRSQVVAFGLADVRSNGQLLATRVPIQVSATRDGNRRLELHVAETGSSEIAGPLHLSWSDFKAADTIHSKRARYIFGGGVLLLILGFTLAATWRQRGDLRRTHI